MGIIFQRLIHSRQQGQLLIPAILTGIHVMNYHSKQVIVHKAQHSYPSKHGSSFNSTNCRNNLQF